MRMKTAAAMGILVWVAVGCASVDEFRALEREVIELKRTRNAPTDQQQRLADLGVEVRELREELARLNGTVEQLEFALGQAREELQRSSSYPPNEGGGSAGASGFDPDGSGRPIDAPSSGGAGRPTTGLSAEVAAYEESFRLYRSGEFSTAIAKFREFLQTYPSSEYADNALFWLGECYFKEGDFASAAVTFEDVAKKFPQGNKVPDALYRQGLALIEIGGKTDQSAAYKGAAREIFQKILDVYPDSERAPEARRQLEKLGT